MVLNCSWEFVFKRRLTKAVKHTSVYSTLLYQFTRSYLVLSPLLSALCSLPLILSVFSSLLLLFPAE